jgi:hypothetical protein
VFEVSLHIDQQIGHSSLPDLAKEIEIKRKRAIVLLILLPSAAAPLIYKNGDAPLEGSDYFSLLNRKLPRQPE